MIKILVTGARGFTASHIIKSLSNDSYNVISTSSKVSENSNIIHLNDFSENNISFILNSINPDFIIHLAAISDVNYTNYDEMFNINVNLVENLLKATLSMREKPKKILISSSANVYGSSQELIKEDSTLNPLNNYAESKLKMENVTKNFFDDLNIIITRPFNYSGPGHKKDFLLPKIAHHFLQKEKEINLGNLNVIRDFSYVSDVVTTYKKLLFCSARSEIVNICSSQGQSIADIVGIFETVAGYKIKVNTINSNKRNNDINIQIGCNEKLKEIIDFAPAPFSKKHVTEFLNLK